MPVTDIDTIVMGACLITTLTVDVKDLIVAMVSVRCDDYRERLTEIVFHLS
jgi:hypothetical protein